MQCATAGVPRPCRPCLRGCARRYSHSLGLAMSTSSRKTRHAWNELGHAHFLTYSCFQRLPLLSKDRSRLWVIEGMEHTRRKLGVAIYAYVIMPEHVHVVLMPQLPDGRIETVMASLKRGVAKKAKDHLATAGDREWIGRLTVRYPKRSVFRFWQAGGGYDHNIWKEHTLYEVIDYIHANPVRRGLADTPAQWYWSSARSWEEGDCAPLAMDPIDL